MTGFSTRIRSQCICCTLPPIIHLFHGFSYWWALPICHDIDQCESLLICNQTRFEILLDVALFISNFPEFNTLEWVEIEKRVLDTYSTNTSLSSSSFSCKNLSSASGRSAAFRARSAAFRAQFAFAAADRESGALSPRTALTALTRVARSYYILR